MLENLNFAAYVTLGFAISYLALEGGWHFTACKIKDKTIPPCISSKLKPDLLQTTVEWSKL